MPVSGSEFPVLVRPVVHLLNLGGPAAVLGGVMPVIVNAINAMIRTWLAPHVLEKGQKASPPATAHCDSAPTPIFELGVVGVVAPLDHVDPSRVLGSLPVAGFPVGDFDFGSLLSLETTAALDTVVQYVVRGYDLLVSAVAAAEKFPLFLAAWVRDRFSLLEDQEPVEALSNHVRVCVSLGHGLHSLSQVRAVQR